MNQVWTSSVVPRYLDEYLVVTNTEYISTHYLEFQFHEYIIFAGGTRKYLHGRTEVKKIPAFV